MVGTDPRTMGGISAVVRGYREAGLFERYPSAYLVTHRDGSGASKLVTAAKSLLALGGMLRRMDAPLVHVHLSSRASFWRKALVCSMATLARRPYLLHVHGSEFMEFYERECGGLAQRLVRRVLDGAALVLALSEQWRVNLRRICPTARIQVLPNAVLLPDLRGRYNGAGGLEILFLGRLGRRKGTFDLVQAFANLALRFPDVRLICAGDGAIEEIRAELEVLRLEGRVDCPGWLSETQARDALARASIFVLPSYAEGLPMALLEAMSWALPVVSTPVGGIPQVIEHGANGLLVEPGDVAGLEHALCELVENAELRTRLGGEARKTIEQTFSLTTAVEQLGRIYAQFGIAPLVAART